MEAKMLLFVDQMSWVPQGREGQSQEPPPWCRGAEGGRPLDFSFSYKCNFILEMCRWEDTFSFSFYFSDILKFLVLVFENV